MIGGDRSLRGVGFSCCHFWAFSQMFRQSSAVTAVTDGQLPSAYFVRVRSYLQ